jgi:hypothetical protein
VIGQRCAWTVKLNLTKKLIELKSPSTLYMYVCIYLFGRIAILHWHRMTTLLSSLADVRTKLSMLVHRWWANVASLSSCYTRICVYMTIVVLFNNWRSNGGRKQASRFFITHEDRELEYASNIKRTRN